MRRKEHFGRAHSQFTQRIAWNIVKNSFEEAYRRTELELQHRTESALVVRKVQLEMPRFFTDLRVELLRRVFARIDVDGGGTLDLNEVTPLIK